MPITHTFDYYKPTRLSDAIELLKDYNGTAAVLAGGTDLLVWLKEGHASPRAVIDIKALPDLDTLTLSRTTLSIGAKVTFSALIASDAVRTHFPVLWEAARTVASVGVRNRATLVGNICSAVPCLDSAPALLVYEASIELCGPNGTRTIPFSAWFTGLKKTARAQDEIVTTVTIPRPGTHGGCYVKLGRYAGEDLAQAGVAILALPKDNYRVAHCAVAPVPQRAAHTEKYLKGKPLSPARITHAVSLIKEAVAPISDIRASREYRLHMLGVMLTRGLKEAVARRDGKGIPLGTSLL